MAWPRRATHPGRAIRLAAFALGLVAATSGQRGGFGSLGIAYDPTVQNVPYDGRFTFLRLRYTVGPGGYYYRGLPAWAHGYHEAEDNLTRILDAISAVHPRLDASNVLALDDPEIFSFPICYMTEAGFWELNDREAAAFRVYLEKGGFVIFDDFRLPGSIPVGGGWDQFAANMRRILPEAEIVDLSPNDPIFHVFFDIDSSTVIPQFYDRGTPMLRGIYEDNDRSKRLMAMINFNTDVSNFWEYAATGLTPVSETDQAYELGVNYIIYGLTH